MNLSQPAERRQLFVLCGALCDGTIADEDFSRINTLLASDPEARRLYIGYRHVHEAIGGLVNEESGKGAAASEIASSQWPVSKRSPVLSFLHAASRHVPGGDPRVFGGLIILVLVAAFWGLNVHLTQRNEHPPHAVAEVPSGPDVSVNAVATIRNSADAEWAKTEGSGDRGTPTEIRNQQSEVVRGERLSITSGLVELQLRQGATLVIEGPAEWSIDGDNNATLKQGKLVAKVPEQAVGFTLDTPSAKIVDLGTEFGVEVQGNGSAKVLVLQGEVQLQSSAAGGAVGSLRLIAGESAKVSSDDPSLTRDSLRPEQFTRSIEGKLKTSPAADERYAQAVLLDKPVAYLRFEKIKGDLLIDESGRGHHATLRGTVKRVPGLKTLGSAGEFHGGDDCAILEDHEDFLPTQSLTIELWLKCGPKISNYGTLVDRNFTAGNYGLGIQERPLETGRLGFRTKDAGVWHPVNVADEQWHHVACIWDGKLVLSMIDGVVGERAPLVGPIDLEAGDLLIGVGFGQPAYQGLMDELAIYDRPLSSDELRLHRELGLDIQQPAPLQGVAEP